METFKNTLNILLILGTFILLISCRSDDEGRPSTIEETYYADYLAGSGFDEEIGSVYGGTYYMNTYYFLHPRKI